MHTYIEAHTCLIQAARQTPKLHKCVFRMTHVILVDGFQGKLGHYDLHK